MHALSLPSTQRMQAHVRLVHHTSSQPHTLHTHRTPKNGNSPELKLQSTALGPAATMVIPITAPTMACVVDTGSSAYIATANQSAVAHSAHSMPYAHTAGSVRNASGLAIVDDSVWTTAAAAEVGKTVQQIGLMDGVVFVFGKVSVCQQDCSAHLRLPAAPLRSARRSWQL